MFSEEYIRLKNPLVVLTIVESGVARYVGWLDKEKFTLQVIDSDSTTYFATSDVNHLLGSVSVVECNTDDDDSHINWAKVRP